MTAENATLGGAVAGVSELQTFLNTYPCQANANNSCESGPLLAGVASGLGGRESALSALNGCVRS